MTPVLAMYGSALLDGGELHVVRQDGSRHRVDVERYRGPVDAVDLDVVDRCSGPTLDVGCGPARFVSALMAKGLPALGVDIAPGAVAAAQSAGATVLQRCVFEQVPGEGRWRHVLLIDENVGIGGCPNRLLSRIRELLAPTGTLHVEADPDDRVDERQQLRVQDAGGSLSRPFSWARLGADAIDTVAGEVGLRTVERWVRGGRSFLTLTPTHPAVAAQNRIDGRATPRPAR